jgi:hypothetical protein
VNVQLVQNAQNVLSAELATVVNAIAVETATAEIHVVTIVSRTDAADL